MLDTLPMPPKKQHATPKDALIASVVGYAMDGFDLLILGFILTPIAQDLHLTGAQSGSLVTWTLLGTVLGGLVFGVLSDHYGRVRVLTWTIILFALFTGLCALATGYWDLVVYRTLAGIGLGGEFGIGMTLVAESWPAGKRARASSYVALGWQVGVLLASFLTPLLLPIIGWRGMFSIGVLPALASFLIRSTINEPELFAQHAKKSSWHMPIRYLVNDLTTTKTSIGMLILCSVQNFGYYGIMIWMPSYLTRHFGYSLTRSSLWTSVTVGGMALGIILFGHLADHFGRKPIFLIYQAGAAISVLCYSRLEASLALLAGGFVVGVFVNGMLGGYGTLLSELYPTQARATAQNVLYNLGRGIGGLGPLLIGFLADRFSFTVATTFLAVIYCIDLVATVLLIPERKGFVLE